MDSSVILATAQKQDEISAIEALMLLQDEKACRAELISVAKQLNERFNGKAVTYVRSKKIHYTNICRVDCKFCSFYKKKNEKKTFALKTDEILKAIREAGPSKQIVLSGGLNPDLNLAFRISSGG